MAKNLYSKLGDMEFDGLITDVPDFAREVAEKAMQDM